MEEFRIGLKRFKDMDEASTAYAQGNEQTAKGFVESFIGTIPEEHEAADKLRKAFDEIHSRRKQEHKDLDKKIETLGFLEQNVEARTGHMMINTVALQDIIESCWRVGREEGLFHD